MSFNDVARDSRTHVDANRARKVVTVFTSDKEGHRPQPIIRTEERRNNRVLNSPRNEEPTTVKPGLRRLMKIVQAPGVDKL